METKISEPGESPPPEPSKSDAPEPKKKKGMWLPKLKRKGPEYLKTMDTLSKDAPASSEFAHCQIIFEKTHICGYRDIAYSMLPADAIAEEDGLYLLNYNGTDLVTIDSLNKPSIKPAAEDNNNSAETEALDSPESCFEAQFWDELRVILTHMNQRMEHIKIGVLIGLCVGALGCLAVFLIVALSGGITPHG